MHQFTNFKPVLKASPKQTISNQKKHFLFYKKSPLLFSLGLFLLTLGVFPSAYGQTTYYATPSGAGAGTQGDPASLTAGLGMLNDGDILLLAAGTYNITNPILNTLPNNATLEGGFDAGNGWTKAGVSTIHRTMDNVEGSGKEQRIGAIYMDNKNGFMIKDMTITTANAPVATTYGISTYGLHLSNCSDYTLNGVQIQVGDASAGANGDVGANGLNGSHATTNDGGDGGGFPNSGGAGGQFGTSGNPGLPGTPGQQADINSCNRGSGGGGGGGGADEADGGSGGNGGGDCNGNNIALGGVGFNEPGANGIDGAAGAAGMNGDQPIIGNQYFQVGEQAPTAEAGIGGTGGGGGKAEDTILGSGLTGEAGGGGGGGGQGGAGGEGGYGGGGSFAVYLFQNGTGTNIHQSSFTAGAVGLGGAGGNGGVGGNGGNGSNWTTWGASGGNGGKGGNGGQGGSGHDGLAQDMYVNGTAPKTILYVNNNPSITTRDGLSWATAYEHLQDAIAITNSNTIGIIPQIWVAASTYYPTTDNPTSTDNTARDVTFYIKNNVEIYGGFAGNETMLEARDWENNPTILSGDIDENTPNIDNNAYHVLLIDGTTANGDITNACIIDGFTIKEGHANGTSNSRGAGILNDARSNNECSPTIRNCSFISNTASVGGAIYNTENGTSNPILFNCSFISNTASAGGAIYNNAIDGTSSPILTNCSFEGNSSGGLGGAIYNNGINGTSSPTITNSSFEGNSASNGGGAILNFSQHGTSSPTITNCSFEGNSTSNKGGAIYNRGNDTGISSPTITNCSFEGNSASHGGGAIYNEELFQDDVNPTLTNCILWNNGDEIVNGGNTTTTLNYSIIDDGTIGGPVNLPAGVSGNNNIDSDPLFVDAANGNLRLQTSSPAIDAANNSVFPMDITTDLDANPRFVNTTIDMGAYENQCPNTFNSNNIIFVKKSALGTKSGNSWTDAFTDLQDAMDLACKCSTLGSDKAIWVASGTYYPTVDNPATASTTARDVTFYINKNIEIYGGFVGNESLLTERDWENNPTILSGDIDNNSPNNDNNAFHVLFIDGTTANGNITDACIIDGFTIAEGNGIEVGSSFSAGAGIYNRGIGIGIGTEKVCSPSLQNCKFVGNSANFGAAIFNDGSSGTSSPTLLNCSFEGNSSTNSGAAIYNRGSIAGASSPTLTNCSFEGNSANFGTAIMNDGYRGISSPTLLNCSFSSNTANFDGGAIYIYGEQGISSPTLTNCSFEGNSAVNNGGAIYFSGRIGNIKAQIVNSLFYNNGKDHIAYDDGNANQQPHFINCTFSGATSFAINIELWNSGMTPIYFTNCIFWGNNGDIVGGNAGADDRINIQHSIIEEVAFASSTNIHQDPLFVNSDLQLMSTSPAINTGNNFAIPAGVLTDLNDFSRIIHAKVDMGAYESIACGGADTDGDNLANHCDICPDHPSRALDFDGSDDYVTATNITGLTTGAVEHTTEAWLYLDGNYKQRSGVLVLGQFGTGAEHWLLRNDIMHIAVWNNTGFEVPLTLGEWLHIAAVFKDGNISIYINGEFYDSKPVNLDLDNTNLSLGKKIFNNNNERYFDGIIDELRIWNVAKTPTEIRANMTQELIGDEDNLVLYYNFNEGVPEADNSALTSSIVDVSGNNNDGTMTNFTKNTSVSNWVIGTPINFLDINAICPAPLPIASIILKGSTLKNSNQLQWTTTNEYQTQFHEIERSANGRDFLPIGKVEAAYHSQIEKHYEWLDKQPLNHAYYRIRILDLDGKESLSNTILLLRPTATKDLWMNLYPNPTSHQVQLDFTTAGVEDLQLKMLDVTGRTVFQHLIKGKEGQNQFAIDLGDFAAGTYFVQLTRLNGAFEVRKLMVQ